MARRERDDPSPTVVFETGDIIPSISPNSAEAMSTASGQYINMQRERTDQPSKRLRKIGHAHAWQYDAEYWVDSLGVVWYAHNYVGSAISRGGWLVGWIDDDGKLVKATDEEGAPLPGVDSTLLAVAQDAVERLAGPGGHADWSRPLGTSLSAVAEGYLIGYSINDDGDPVPGFGDDGLTNPDAVEERWEAYSPTLVSKEKGEDDRWRFKVRRSIEGQMDVLPVDAVGVRIFRRGRFPEDPDGAMLALNDVCEDMQLLQRAIRGSALSRTHAGLLLIPQEGLGQAMPAQALLVGGAGVDGLGPPLNPVVTSIIAGLSAPARDPGSAASLVPTPVVTKGDHIQNWKHLPLGRDIDPQLATERQELLRQFAQGNDMPPEIILGMADLNHWTAWQVGADAWRHIEPTVIIMRDGLTYGYLWPTMRAATDPGSGEDGEALPVDPDLRERIKRFRMLFDPVDVLIDPDHSADADKAFEQGAISWEAYRRYKGFDPKDAPTDDELAKRLELGYSRARPSPQAQDEGIPGPPETPIPAKQSAKVVTASATPSSIAGLPRAMAALDLQHLSRTMDLVESAVSEAVAQAGAQMRTKAQGDPTLKSMLRGKPAREVGLTIGPAAAARLFAGEGDQPIEHLFTVALGAMLVRYRQVTTAVLGQYARQVAKYTGEPLTDAEIAEYTTDAVASEAVLSAGVMEVARARLFDQAAHAITAGEAPAGITVPTQVARRASMRAGGVQIDGSVKPLERFEGGIATGPHRTDQLQRRGLVKTGIEWIYGDEARMNSFEPHEDLDGLDFTGPDDEGLDVAPWGLAFPGDHNGCACTWAVTFDVSGGEGDEAE